MTDKLSSSRNELTNDEELEQYDASEDDLLEEDDGEDTNVEDSYAR